MNAAIGVVLAGVPNVSEKMIAPVHGFLNAIHRATESKTDRCIKNPLEEVRQDCRSELINTMCGLLLYTMGCVVSIE